jgi:hypothetical protein
MNKCNITSKAEIDVEYHQLFPNTLKVREPFLIILQLCSPYHHTSKAHIRIYLTTEVRSKSFPIQFQKRDPLFSFSTRISYFFVKVTGGLLKKIGQNISI